MYKFRTDSTSFVVLRLSLPKEFLPKEDLIREQEERSLTYLLRQLFDFKELEQLVNNFTTVTGIGSSIVDVDGVPLVNTSGQHICLKYHRQNPIAVKRCQISDRYINEHLHDGPYVAYECMNGLMDYAAPIMVNDTHIGIVYAGQLFNEPPDEERFRRQARELDVDEEAYIEAMHRVPVIPAERIEAMLLLFMQTTSMLASMALDRIQRMEAEEAARAREERLQLVLEGSQDGFWDWQAESGQVFLSPRCSEVLGYSPAELLPSQETWERLVHPDDLPAAVSMLKEHMGGKTPYFTVEFRVRSQLGQWHWVLARAKVVSRDASGKPLRMAGTVSDITLRKQMETALRESEELYRSLVETSPNAITLFGLDGTVLFINQQGVDLFACGESANSLKGTDGLDFLAPEEHLRLLKDYSQALRDGSKRNLEYTCLRRDGTRFIAELNFAVVRDAEGQPASIIALMRDITKRKRLEQEVLEHRNHLQELVQQRTKALRLSEEKFSKAFNASPIAMTISTLEEGRYLDVNEAFCRAVGYERQEIIGRTSREIGIWIHGDRREQWKDCILNNEPIRNLEVQFLTHTRETRVGIIFMERLDIGEEPCILTILDDITEQRRIDMEMARLDRLQLIGEMAASIGHEIRNPMTTVRGLLQLLGSEEVYQKDKELLDLMIEEMDRANSIITEFLSLAKDKRVELVPKNLGVVLTSVLALVQANAIAQDKRVVAEVDPVPERPLDEKEIRQLILNLSQNGLEAMSSGGTLTLRVYSENDDVILAVHDHGCGIDPEVIDKLGMPFITTKENGTGLGLSVCYGIADRHGASIDIDTGPGGTTVYVRFPGKKRLGILPA